MIYFIMYKFMTNITYILIIERQCDTSKLAFDQTNKTSICYAHMSFLFPSPSLFSFSSYAIYSAIFSQPWRRYSASSVHHTDISVRPDGRMHLGVYFDVHFKSMSCYMIYECMFKESNLLEKIRSNFSLFNVLSAYI